MKLNFFSLLLLAISTALLADPIKVGDTEVTFEAPENFKPLSKELIATKWPTNRAPAYAVGTPTGSTTVAYDLKPHHIPQDALPEAQKSFTQLFERMIPGIDWKKNEIIEHSGQKWLLMEMTSSAVDTDVHNIMLMTGFSGKMLVFNFNSTKEDFPKHEAALRRSVYSVKLPKLVAAPPSDADSARVLIGSWASQNKPGKINGITTHKPDGTFFGEASFMVPNPKPDPSPKITITLKIEGKWRVEGGILIGEVTSSSHPTLVPLGLITRDTLISVNEKEYRYRTEKGVEKTVVRMEDHSAPTAPK